MRRFSTFGKYLSATIYLLDLHPRRNKAADFQSPSLACEDRVTPPSNAEQAAPCRVTSGSTYSHSLHLQEDGSLEGFLPDCQVGGQLHPEGVALTVADQNAEAKRLAAVLLLRRVFQAQVEPGLQPAVLRHPQLQQTHGFIMCWRKALANFSLRLKSAFRFCPAMNTVSMELTLCHYCCKEQKNVRGEILYFRSYFLPN